MKKILFLLLCTVTMYGQTYQNPTFGTVTSKTNVEDNSAEKILVQNSLGKFNWIYKNSLIPDNFTKVVYVNNNNPNGATIFDLNNPPVTNDNLLKSDVNNLYIGTDASTWVYNTPTLNYVTKTVTSNTSNFYLAGTSTDAGNTKTASVYRTGKISVGADVSSSDAFTVTGNSKFIGLAKIGDNPIGSSPNRITQNVGSDDWSIYGEAATIDQGKLIFEVGDNSAPISSNGQAFQFRYNSVSSGVAKNPLTIDYNDITALANVTATSFIKSGAIATHALLAGGGTLSNPIGGTGVNGQVSFWNGANSQAGDSGFSWNNSTKALSIISPTSDILSIQNTSAVGRTTLTALNNSGEALAFGITGSSFVTTTDFGKAGDAFIRSSLMAKDLNLINANQTEGSIKFINSGAERMRVAFSGNILIGKTTPDTGEKLQVNGNIAANAGTTANHVVVKSQLDLKANTASPTFTGNPTAPTPTAGDNDTSIATTAFVTGAIATADAGSVKLIGNQSITGVKTVTNSATAGRFVFQTLSNAVSTSLVSVSQSSSYPGIEAQAGASGARAIMASTITGGDAVYIKSNMTGSGGTASSLLLIDNVAAGNDITPVRIKKEGVEVAKIDYLGNATVNNITLTGVLKLKAYTVGTLPAGTVGDMAYVTDATAPTYSGTLIGGGAVKIPVFYDGTAWKAH